MVKLYQENDSGKIYNGDSIELMKSMPDKSVDLILTDPPYGVNLGYDVYDDTEENWYKLMNQFIPEAQRVSTMTIFPACNIGRLGWYYKNYIPLWVVVWYKGSVGCTAALGFNDWEAMLVYGKNKGVCMHDYVHIQPDEKMGKYGHPCPKPLGWAKWFIERTTEEGMVVFDPFAGSGTTAVASNLLDRKYIACDLSEEYCEIIKNRLDSSVSLDKRGDKRGRLF